MINQTDIDDMTDERADIARAACALDETLAGDRPHRLRLSWSRDHEGVVAIYGTDENTGRVANFADLWLSHLVDRLGYRREYAKQVQTDLADMIVEAWNAKHSDCRPSQGMAGDESLPQPLIKSNAEMQEAPQ